MGVSGRFTRIATICARRALASTSIKTRAAATRNARLIDVLLSIGPFFKLRNCVDLLGGTRTNIVIGSEARPYDLWGRYSAVETEFLSPRSKRLLARRKARSTRSRGRLEHRCERAPGSIRIIDGIVRCKLQPIQTTALLAHRAPRSRSCMISAKSDDQRKRPRPR